MANRLIHALAALLLPLAACLHAPAAVQETLRWLDAAPLDGLVIGDYVVSGSCVYDAAGRTAMQFDILDTEDVDVDVYPMYSLLSARQVAQAESDWEFSDEVEEGDWGADIESCLYLPLESADTGKEKNGSADDRRYLVAMECGTRCLRVIGYGSQPVSGGSPVRRLDPVYPDAAVLPAEEARSLAAGILRAHAAAAEGKSLPVDKEAEQRRLQLHAEYLARHQARLDRRNAVRPEYADDMWNGRLADPGAAAVKRLGLRVPKGTPAIPNPRRGVHRRADFLPRLCALAAAAHPGQPVYVREHPMPQDCAGFTITAGGTAYHICLAHAYNTAQAAAAMCTMAAYADAAGAFRTIRHAGEEFPRLLSSADLAAQVEKAARPAAGELSIRLRPAPQDPAAARSLYFIRGNTAAGVFAGSPAASVLPLAQEIDRMLRGGR